MTRAIRVTPLPAPGRRYTGKRARRQAFADRQRTARALQRIVNSIDIEQAMLGAYSDMLVHGVGAIKVERIEPLPPEIDPLTGHPWAWPYRFRRMTRKEFEAEFPSAPQESR